jgi:UDP-N-acetylmuramoyl-tripeptide--D-alanyl-D-alanine ligase
LCAFGPLSAAIAAGAREGGLKDVFHTEDIDSAVRWLRERLDPAAWALIKGSRGMRLERIARALADEAGVEFGGKNASASRG